VERAAGPGLDPFRTRASLWPALPQGKRRTLIKALRREIERRRADLLHELPSLDEGDAIATTLHVALQDLRLQWLEKRLKEK
jgi:acyl-CoA reductase-like NAD-dependent aldehyde dehydrogenase